MGNGDHPGGQGSGPPILPALMEWRETSRLRRISRFGAGRSKIPALDFGAEEDFPGGCEEASSLQLAERRGRRQEGG